MFAVLFEIVLPGLLSIFTAVPMKDAGVEATYEDPIEDVETPRLMNTRHRGC